MGFLLAKYFFGNQVKQSRSLLFPVMKWNWKNMPLKKSKIRRSPSSPFFIRKTISLMQNKPHCMKRGHPGGRERNNWKEKKKTRGTRGNYESFFSYGKYLHVYFKPNINVNILNKQKHTRGNNRVLFVCVCFCFFVVFFKSNQNCQDSACIFLNTLLQKAGCKGCCIFNFSVNYGLSIVVSLVLKTQLRK